MDKQKFETILDRLLKLSEEDKLNWKATANPNKYLLTLNDSSIVIDHTGPIKPAIKFEFKNEKGETVEIISVDQKMENYHISLKLYDLIYRKTLDPDKTIDRILKQLEPDSIAA